MSPRASSFLLFLFLFVAGCQPSADPTHRDTPAPQDPNNAAFVTLLGNDTLVVEQFRRTPTRMEAQVVLRTPRTTVRHYTLDLEPDGALRQFEAVIREPAASPDAPPNRRDVVTVRGDSLQIATTRDGETETHMMAGEPGMIPFLDMIHWPFELMLTRAYATAQDSVIQTQFAGTRSLPFVVRRVGEGAMSVTHPSRGTMQTRIDGEGRLLSLDAGTTTRKLKVSRVPSVDIAALAHAFAGRDAAGQSFGPLSARGEALATIEGATIQVDYGTPSKRGRDIFGALVPYGQVWRTGANRATHFTTDRDLVVGSLDVPAGEYTLYTIPDASGGILIINTQTGQGGTTYHEDRDLGRADLTLGALEETVEVFTILVEETDEGGTLKLQWDRTELSIPITVK